jgi:hypothetical protein
MTQRCRAAARTFPDCFFGRARLRKTKPILQRTDFAPAARLGYTQRRRAVAETYPDCLNRVGEAASKQNPGVGHVLIKQLDRESLNSQGTLDARLGSIQAQFAPRQIEGVALHNRIGRSGASPYQ